MTDSGQAIAPANREAVQAAVAAVGQGPQRSAPPASTLAGTVRSEPSSSSATASTPTTTTNSVSPSKATVQVTVFMLVVFLRCYS